MTRIGIVEAKKEAARIIASIMASRAITAPKTYGANCIETLIIDAEDLQVLADAIELSAKDKPPYLDTAYELDARNVRNSDCVLLIGVTANPRNIKEPMDCGYCSYLTCERLSAAIKRKKASHKGPLCILQAVNLGIALGSAAKVASDLNVDNR